MLSLVGWFVIESTETAPKFITEKLWTRNFGCCCNAIGARKRTKYETERGIMCNVPQFTCSENEKWCGAHEFEVSVCFEVRAHCQPRNTPTGNFIRSTCWIVSSSFFKHHFIVLWQNKTEHTLFVHDFLCWISFVCVTEHLLWSMQCFSIWKKQQIFSLRLDKYKYSQIHSI